MALTKADQIIIGPSNPILSIGPHIEYSKNKGNHFIS